MSRLPFPSPLAPLVKTFSSLSGTLNGVFGAFVAGVLAAKLFAPAFSGFPPGPTCRLRRAFSWSCAASVAMALVTLGESWVRGWWAVGGGVAVGDVRVRASAAARGLGLFTGPDLPWATGSGELALKAVCLPLARQGFGSGAHARIISSPASPNSQTTVNTLAIRLFFDSPLHLAQQSPARPQPPFTQQHHQPPHSHGPDQEGESARYPAETLSLGRRAAC